LGAPELVQDEGPVGGNVAVQVLPTLLGDQLTTERVFADLARASQEHHFLGQVSLHTFFKVAFHARYFLQLY
jgi:hypothetical protein